MDTNISSCPVSERLPDTLAPELETRNQDRLLQELSRALVADAHTEPEPYLEEVRVVVGGE
jgi:hypothetical protein